ncbi:MAG: membrane protein insertase YidC [Alphaproteobacteria bacterium]|nr:membrane protein insertase YidC [Alphaproteobacteria bacterium]
MQNNKDQMHPQDARNLIIFGIVSIFLWFLYDIYILKPQADALRKAKIARQELILNNPEIKEYKPLERAEALKASERLTFDNGKIFGSIALRGGRIDDLSLREYFQTLEKKNNVILFSPEKTLESRYTTYGWISPDKSVRLPNEDTLWQVEGNRKLTQKNPITLRWNNGQGLVFERKISLDENFVFNINQTVYNNSNKDVKLAPYALLTQTGIPSLNRNTWVMHEGPMGYFGSDLEQRSFQSMDDNPNELFQAETGWIGMSDKYWLTALLPSQNVKTTFRFKYTKSPLKTIYDRFQTDYTGPVRNVERGKKIENIYHLYAGAKKVLLLEKYERSLGVSNIDLAVDFGWFWFFTYPFFLALHYVGLLVGNMGVAIILLTCIIRGAVFPLTNISYRSFAKMKVVSPKIVELREAYADEPEKLQQAIVELYQKEKVNPLSGCFPILIQIPIFFAFYKILFITIEIRHAPFFGWIQDLSAKDPTSFLNLFGLLPFETPAMLAIGAWPCMMFVVMMVQKQLNPPPQDKMQRDMMRFFPFFITWIMSGFAAGLVIYWTFSGFIGIIQQMIIMRSLNVPIYIFNKDKFTEKLEKQIDEGPAVHPLIEMAEEDAEKALFGESASDRADSGKDIKPPKPKKKKKKK